MQRGQVKKTPLPTVVLEVKEVLRSRMWALLEAVRGGNIHSWSPKGNQPCSYLTWPNDTWVDPWTPGLRGSAILLF